MQYNDHKKNGIRTCNDLQNAMHRKINIVHIYMINIHLH